MGSKEDLEEDTKLGCGDKELEKTLRFVEPMARVQMDATSTQGVQILHASILSYSECYFHHAVFY